MTDSKLSYWFVPPEVAELNLPLLETTILGVVYSFTRNGGECWATDKQFASRFQVGHATVERALSRLYTLGVLSRKVERKPNGTTPRRLFLTLPSRQIDATPLSTDTPYPHSEGTPMQQLAYPYPHSEGTLPSNDTPPTLTMRGPYPHSEGQIVINKNKKEVIESTAPADAPAPSSPLKDLLSTDSGIKESFTTEDTESSSLEKPESVIGEAPPISPTPPGEGPEPRRFVVAELSEADRSKLLAQLKGPATLAGKDPEKLLAEILGRAEAWSNTGTDKKKFRPSWYETLKRQFVGKEIKALSARTAKAPASQTGLSRDQIDTLWDLGWKDHHPADWPEPAPEPKWVTDWHRNLYDLACRDAFGLNYSKTFEQEPARNSNFHAPKFRRAMETIKLPETN